MLPSWACEEPRTRIQGPQGVELAEVAFRLGAAHRIEVDLSQLRVLSWPVLALVLIAVLATALAIAGQVQIEFPALGALAVQIGR